MTNDVVVIGGGISGLAAAYELTRRGHRVVVLERQVRVGGTATSERIGGFLMEHGPSTVNAGASMAATLSRSVGLDSERCELGPEVRYRYLVGGGRLHRIATHPFGFFTSDYMSLLARIRIASEVLVPRLAGDGEETVAEFCSRRFGREFTDRVIDPMVGGLYASLPQEVSIRAVLPSLFEMERRYGSIIRGMVRSRLAGGRMPGRRLYSWRNGIGSLPKELARKLGPAVKTGVAVRSIRRSSEGFCIEAGSAGTITARSIVVATQPHVAAALLETVEPLAAQAAAAIEAPPLAVVFLGYPRRQVAHPLDGLGYLVPSSETRDLTGALFCSTMFPGRAPEGHVALAGYIGGARAPDLARQPPADLIAMARRDFGDLVGASGEPTIARARIWPRGLPQCRRGHDRLVAALRTITKRCPGLFVTGNYIAGVSVGNCLAQASETSFLAHRFLVGEADSGSQATENGPLPMRFG